MFLKRLHLFIDLTMKFKDEVYGIHILIFVMRNAPVLNENTMKNVALKELKVEVDMENSFQIWAYNKTKESYVFQDRIPSNGYITNMTCMKHNWKSYKLSKRTVLNLCL